MCGNGAIATPLREAGHLVVASDIVDRGCPDAASEIDFLATKEVPPGIDALVSNPPFNKAEEVIYHALYTLKVPKVIMLLRLAFLEGGNLKSYKGHCRRSVLDNGHLAKFLLFRKRLPMMYQENYVGKKNSNSGMPFMWAVWDLSHEGRPKTFERISWEPILPPPPIETYIASLN
jgi:hypothetical protein